MSLDARLGVRMLVKHRWLTLAGGGHHHDQRPAALGRRHARADVVHRRAADPRDRHPFGLGAQPRQLLFGLFAGAMRQLAIGLLVGSLASVGVFAAAGIALRPAAGMLLIVAVVMAGVASFAALGPARRSLSLPAVEALRLES